MKHRPNLQFVVLFAIAVVGCKSSTDAPAGFTISGVPGVGSTFTFHVKELNANGSVSQEYDVTQHVTKHEQSWNGRQNVVLVEDQKGWVYESNGNLSEYAKSGVAVSADPKWATLPFSNDHTYATTYEDDGFGKATVTSSYYGSEGISVGGKQYQAARVRLVDQFVESITNKTYSQVYDFWYVPEIKYLVRNDEGAYTDRFGATHAALSGTLTSYTLK